MSTAAGSRGRWEARTAHEAIGRTLSGPQEPLQQLRALRHAHEALSWSISSTVEAARADGASWVDVGGALGISRQAARQAHLRRVELEDQRAEARQWRLPLPYRRPRLSWWTRNRPQRRRDAA